MFKGKETTVQITSHATASAESTLDLGRLVGAGLSSGDVVLLSGKTVLAHGIVQGIGATRWNGSPTFTLINEYRGRVDVAHADLYRLSEGEADDLGLDEYVERGWALLLEWPERDPGLAERLRANRIVQVSIQVISPTQREITLQESLA